MTAPYIPTKAECDRIIADAATGPHACDPRTCNAPLCSGRLARAVNHLRDENEQLRKALVEMVAQHCGDSGVVDDAMCSMGIAANEAALMLLADLGIVTIVKRVGRVIKAVWSPAFLAQSLPPPRERCGGCHA